MNMSKKENTGFWFVLTKEEKDLLKKTAIECGVSMARFLKTCIKYFSEKNNYEKLFTSRDGRKAFSDLKYEVNRYGNNLNQIAYKLNREKSGFSEKEKKEMVERLRVIGEGVGDVKRMLSEIKSGLDGE